MNPPSKGDCPERMARNAAAFSAEYVWESLRPILSKATEDLISRTDDIREKILIKESMTDFDEAFSDIGKESYIDAENMTVPRNCLESIMIGIKKLCFAFLHSQGRRGDEDASLKEILEDTYSLFSKLLFEPGEEESIFQLMTRSSAALISKYRNVLTHSFVGFRSDSIYKEAPISIFLLGSIMTESAYAYAEIVGTREVSLYSNVEFLYLANLEKYSKSLNR